MYQRAWAKEAKEAKAAKLEARATRAAARAAARGSARTAAAASIGEPAAPGAMQRTMPRMHVRRWDRFCLGCGKKGHVVTACKGTSLEAIKCSCCGQMGHKKAECPKNHMKCGVCDQTGHLELMCWHKNKPKAKEIQGAAKASPEKSPWTNADATAWQCPNNACRAMQFNEAASKCRLCKTQRIKEADEGEKTAQEAQAQRELLPMRAVGREVIGRVSKGADEEDISRPKAEQEAMDEYHKLTDLIEYLEKNGEPDWAEQKRKIRSKLPKPASNRQLRDQADAINYCAELEEKFAKKTAECEAARESIIHEQEDAVKALEADKEKEKEEHAKRLKFLQEQSVLKQKHLDKKLLENADLIARLRNEYESKRTEAIAITKKLGGAEAWHGVAEPIAQLLKVSGAGATAVGVVTSDQIDQEEMVKKMLMDPAMNGLSPELAHTMCAWQLKYLNEKAVVVQPQRQQESRTATPGANGDKKVQDDGRYQSQC